MGSLDLEKYIKHCNDFPRCWSRVVQFTEKAAMTERTIAGVSHIGARIGPPTLMVDTAVCMHDEVCDPTTGS